MSRSLSVAAAAAAIVASLFSAGCAYHHYASAPSMPRRVVEVGGAPMLPSRTIVENAMQSRDHTTLVEAVEAASMVDELSGPGPFTVFAPTNEAFDKLPPAAMAALIRPENRPALSKILSYHVVPGRFTTADLAARVRAGNGRAMLTTVQGATLTITQAPNGVLIADARGGMSNVTIADVMQANGIIHVVDTVLMPPV